jgi:hypothetical protein
MNYISFYKELFERYAGSKSLRGIWYHGTSTKYLQSILSQGLIPFPKEKSWDVDPDASSDSLDRTTYGGIYVTRNLLTAYSAAWRTAKKTNGNRLVVMIDLQPKSLIADEDDVARYFTNYNTLNALFYYKIYKYGTNYTEYLDELEKEKEKFADYVINKIKSSYDIKNNPNLILRLKELIKNEGYVAAITRIVSYYENSGYGNQWHRCWDTREIDIKDIPPLPSKEEGESLFRNFIQKFTKTLKQIATLSDFSQKGRSLQPIRFSGSNKIVCIIELIENPAEPTKIKIHYGSLPNDFIKQYKERIRSDFNPDELIVESIVDSFEYNNKYIEVFKNPTLKELKSCISFDEFGAFLQDNDIFTFDRMSVYHQAVRQRNRKHLDQALSLLVWVETNGYSVLVTDNNISTKWNHNPDTETYIRNHPFFNGKVKDVIFFDQDIVGDWSLLKSK